MVISSINLEHIFGSDVHKDGGILMPGKRQSKPLFAYNDVRIFSLLFYTDFVEYKIVRDTKAPLLRCFPFMSKVKSVDVITTRQYMENQTFSNLQLRRLLKNSFCGVQIDLRDTSGEKNPSVSVGKTRLVLMFRKVSELHFKTKTCAKWLLQEKYNFPITKEWEDNKDGCLALSLKLFENCYSFLEKIRRLNC